MYHIEDEITGLACGFDYQSFVEGFRCPNLATKIIIDDLDSLHWAHLCEEHANKELAVLLGEA